MFTTKGIADQQHQPVMVAREEGGVDAVYDSLCWQSNGDCKSTLNLMGPR